MTASTLTVAPAIDTTPSFHRSHSTSDLFSLSASLSKPAPPLPPSATTATPAAKSSSHVRALSLKSLPSLPAFDVPSFDFDPDFSSKLLLDAPLLGGPVTKPTKQQAKEVDVRPKPVQVERPLPKPGGGSGAEAGGTGGGGGGILNRKRSIIDRPRSWMPTTRSTPNFRELIQEQARSRPSADGGRERVRERQSGLFDQPPRLQLPGLEQDGGIQLEKKNVARAGADVETAPRSVAGDRGRTVSDSFTALSKRSWMTMRSRSPSPVSKERARPEKSLPEKPLPEPAAPVVERSIGVGGESMGKDWFADLGNFNIVGPTKEPEPDSEAEPELELSSARKRPAVELESSRTSNSPSGTARAISRASVYLSKIKQKPQSVFSKSAAVAVNGDSDSCASSATSLADNRRSQSPSENTTMTTTDDMSSSAASSDMAVQTPEKPRDPLWAQFKKLEAEFLRFQAKNTTVRVSIVRTTLFPFLRTYAHHESNRDLAAEDLDRRCVILNRWWGALLEMLDPNYPTTMGGTLAGVDRAAVLECVTLIMTRPEWRRTTSYFCPLRDRHPGERVRARSWTQSSMNSLSAISAAAAAESAETNVRNMFVTNLLTQMQLVVDRMSARHVPNSVVNFCGRACAYAFFFAPGIADVLVRLWGLAPDLIRRVADELGLPRRSRGESEDIVALFPPCLSGLGWSSVKTMTDLLRQNVKLPLLASTIPWHGPWVPRWKGRDTDLLFVFAKHFHILAEEFMPSGLPLIEKARAPAFVLVHCQLLSCLDSTIHRQAAVDALLGGPFMAAEGFGGPDAASFLGGAGGAGPMATPPLLTQNHNVFKGMSENRMIMLLKDFLIEGAGAGIDDARNTFAEAFMAVIRAATKRTSQFDHNACFTLCDFLEEALPAYEAFRELEQPDDPVGGGFVDWDFWFGVCRMVLDSNNTVSEIRMLAFVFAMWDIAVASDPVRKEAVCINWLLTEDNFNKFFNHWCPMVRAYYHRLLCWRVCRDAGSANEVDAKIFLLVSTRLMTVWSHYLWVKQVAEQEGKYLPSTAPCHPTPGKRFMIIRTEVDTVQPGLFMGFDSISRPFEHLAATNRNLVDDVPATSGSGKGSDKGNSYKKKWSLLGKVLSFTSPTAAAGVTSTTGQQANINSAGNRTWDDDSEPLRRGVSMLRARQATTAATTASTLSAATVASSTMPTTAMDQQPTSAAAVDQQGPPPPPPPPKQPPTSQQPGHMSSDSDSTGSSPIFDAAQFVFKFTLAWQPANAPPPRERILTRPRLPAPAQARVSAKMGPMRSGSPPPPAPGLPPPNRRISGLHDQNGGLVAEARNASPRIRPTEDDGNGGGRTSFSSIRAASLDLLRGERSTHERSASPTATATTSAAESATSGSRRAASPAGSTGSNSDSASNSPALRAQNSQHHQHQQQQVTQPIKPTGAGAIAGSKYAGRALAEWSIVVSECNSFVDRRRDEGVLGLSEVEVPSLGVDGFRKLG